MPQVPLEWTQIGQLGTNVLLLIAITVLWRDRAKRDGAYDTLLRECVQALTLVADRLGEHNDHQKAN